MANTKSTTRAVESYPPSIHRTELHRFLNTEQVCQLIGVTPLTARRILRGCDLKLSHAITLAKRLDVSVHDLWRQK